MKRRTKKCLALFLALTLLLPLWSCGNDDGPGMPGSSQPATPDSPTPSEASSQAGWDALGPLVTERWKVYYVDEASLLALPEGAENTGELSSFSLINVDETKGKLARGAVVEIVYGGAIMACFPGRVTGVRSITVVEPGEDLLSLYLDILDELYETDPGLNPEGSMEVSITYGIDLSEVHNLTEADKGMVAYFFSGSHDTDWEKAQPAGFVLGTYQELVDQGYIDGEELYFEDGVLFTIRDEPAENGKFSFSAQKWRSGTGAIFYDDCQAEKKDGVWTYELGGFAIS